jgi:hypothetical protein
MGRLVNDRRGFVAGIRVGEQQRLVEVIHTVREDDGDRLLAGVLAREVSRGFGGLHGCLDGSGPGIDSIGGNVDLDPHGQRAMNEIRRRCAGDAHECCCQQTHHTTQCSSFHDFVSLRALNRKGRKDDLFALCYPTNPSFAFFATFAVNPRCRKGHGPGAKRQTRRPEQKAAMK